MIYTKKLRVFSLTLLVLFFTFALPNIKSAEAATYHWAHWTSYSFDGTTYTLTGTITTAGDTVTVTYTNTQGVAGYQLDDGSGGNTNYYDGGTDGATGTSPYTSATVENRPDNVTIVRLKNAGTQTLTFNKSIANLALAFVSLNGNAFSFDRNFDILSFGDPSDGGNACGHFGCGTATKTTGAGSYPYVVSGTGEPHGTLRFPGSFSSLTWTSGNEDWHGFTVGIEGTSGEVGSDTTPPIVTFNPADKATNITANTDITITFDEEVRNLDDTPLTSTNVDALITLKTNNASGADIPFDATIDSANKVITINPTSDFSADQIIYAAIGATVEDTYGNAISAAHATMTTGSSLPSETTYEDPRGKQDVVGNIEAWSSTAERWFKSNLSSVAYRMDWLRRNKNTDERSHNGLHIRAADPVVDGLIKASSGEKSTIAFSDVANFAQAYSSGQSQAMSDAKSGMANTAFSQLAQAAQNVFGETNTNLIENAFGQSLSWFKSFFGNWSLWTQGEVVFGKIKGSGGSPQQDAHDYYTFIGMDTPIHQDGLLGIALGLGKSDTNVGSLGSGVQSDNYSIAGYTAFKLPTSQTIEATLGYGRMKMDIVRIDGSQTLSGARNARQIFGSIALRAEPLVHGKFSISPYGRVEGAHADLDEFSEEGGDQALTFARQYLNTASAFIGTDVEYDMKIGNRRFRPFGKLEYGASANYKSDVEMHYVLDATEYSLVLGRQAASTWRSGIGFDYQISNGAALSFEYFRTQAINSGYLDSLRLQVDITF